ncbi:MAG: flavodoxin [Bacteroidota bacterium]
MSLEFQSKPKIGLVYGSDTGMTEEITGALVDKCNFWDIEVSDVHSVRTEDTDFFERFQFIILGLSTWYDGDLQSDWEDYYDEFKTVDFSGKIVAIYGLGDQYGYDDYFIDGVGMLAEVVLQKGGILVGHWPTEGYDFSKSKALMNDSTFYGLALDEDNQPELTNKRLDAWLIELKTQFERHTLKIVE